MGDDPEAVDSLHPPHYSPGMAKTPRPKREPGCMVAVALFWILLFGPMLL